MSRQITVIFAIFAIALQFNVGVCKPQDYYNSGGLNYSNPYQNPNNNQYYGSNNYNNNNQQILSTKLMKFFMKY